MHIGEEPFLPASLQESTARICNWRNHLAMCLTLIWTPLLPCQSDSSRQLIPVDPSQIIGTIKRMNDVDNGPLCQRGLIDLSQYYKALGIRNVRLHDVPWTYDNVLDINYVFPDWNADPDRAESYDFAQSDFYIKTITDLGINIIFRLGYSAEYRTAVHHNRPPLSDDKWADIAAHIVRHYNQGWAGGPKANIKYWEIWNEPDGDSLVFWAGTPEAFYHLYETTARKLKQLDPTLKVGGPALVGSLPFLEGFLKYSQKHQVPVDFVSWHMYTQDPHQVAHRANEVHALMKQYGFVRAESIVDEWNYEPHDWKKLFVDPAATRAYFDASQDSFGAAFDATVMTDLQDAPVDIATFFSGTTFMWGLFTSSGAPQKAYYSFLAFQRVMETPERISLAPAHPPDLSILAGVSKDKTMVRVLVTNLARDRKKIRLELRRLPWSGPAFYEQTIVDEHHNLEPLKNGALPSTGTRIDADVDGPSVSLFTITPALE